MSDFVVLELESDFFFNEETVRNILKSVWSHTNVDRIIKRLKQGEKPELSWTGKHDFEAMAQELHGVGVKATKKVGIKKRQLPFNDPNGVWNDMDLLY